MSHQDEGLTVAAELKLQARILIRFVSLFWIVELLDQVIFQFMFRGGLDQLGIQPGKLIGLRGILFAPFLHGSWGHLLANTIPFLVLGWFVMLQETSDFFVVTLFSMGVAGVGTWLLGAPNSVHIGASSLIYGYLGFLLLRGYFERKVNSILVSILVFLLYGGVVWGVFPTQAGVSWQGHLFGFIGGVWAARYIGKERRTSRF